MDFTWAFQLANWTPDMTENRIPLFHHGIYLNRSSSPRLPPCVLSRRQRLNSTVDTAAYVLFCLLKLVKFSNCRWVLVKPRYCPFGLTVLVCYSTREPSVSLLSFHSELEWALGSDDDEGMNPMTRECFATYFVSSVRRTSACIDDLTTWKGIRCRELVIVL